MLLFVLYFQDAEALKNSRNKNCENQNGCYPFYHSDIKMFHSERPVEFDLADDSVGLYDKADNNAGQHTDKRQENAV